MRGLLLPGLLLLSAAVVATPAAAQQAPPPAGTALTPVVAAGATAPQGGTGRVMGVVTAPDLARLPGATMTISNPTSGWSVVVVTASHGGYSGSSLPPGDYDIKVELAGFQTQVVQGVTVTSGDSRDVNFTLALSTVTETVTVQGALVKDSIEASDIRDSSARDIGEALSRLNGLSLVRKGAIANDIVLHGYQSRNLTVLIDGERIYGACPNGMDPAVFHADFAEVDHLEVAKGPFDVRHQGSLGGLVNVVTRAPGAGSTGARASRRVPGATSTRRAWRRGATPEYRCWAATRIARPTRTATDPARCSRSTRTTGPTRWIPRPSTSRPGGPGCTSRRGRTTRRRWPTRGSRRTTCSTRTS